MHREDQPSAAAQLCRRWRDGDADEPPLRIGFVPTMGALHAGHLELVRRSARENDRTVVSIFVNPLQFDDAGDLAAYPRDFDADCAQLEAAGADLAFTGDLEGFFPEYESADAIERLDPGPVAEGLEGAHRPGHFEGVATIVRRLFDLVRPHAAYFGAKDWQQTLVVRGVTRGDEPRIVVVPTVREADGLALSSRNARLSSDERALATVVSRALFAARDAFADGERDATALEARMAAVLEQVPAFEVEYAVVRGARDLAPFRGRIDAPASAAAGGGAVRGLIAGRLGTVRLIDNLGLDETSDAPPAAGANA